MDKSVRTKNSQLFSKEISFSRAMGSVLDNHINLRRTQ